MRAAVEYARERAPGPGRAGRSSPAVSVDTDRLSVFMLHKKVSMDTITALFGPVTSQLISYLLDWIPALAPVDLLGNKNRQPIKARAPRAGGGAPPAL